jgi:hypothetical protein
MTKTTNPLTVAERQARYRSKYRRYSFGAQKLIDEIIQYHLSQKNCTTTQAIERLIYEGHKALWLTKK